MRKAASQNGSGHHEAGRAAPRHQLVDLAERRIGVGVAVPGGTKVGDHPPAIADDRKEGENAVAMPEDVEMICRVQTGNVAVGQCPVRLEGRALERKAEPVAHGRVSAVASHEPVGLERFPRAVCTCEHGFDGGPLVGETRQLDRPLDRHAGHGQPFLEHPLGLALGNHQRIGEAAVDQVERDPGHDLRAGRDLRAMRRHAGRQEVLGIPGIVQQFERPAPQDEGLGFVRSGGGPVDDTDGNPVPHQLVGEGETHRAGAGDQHFRMAGHANSHACLTAS